MMLHIKVTYEGYFINNNKHGYGLSICNDPKFTAQGYFKDNQRHGNFIINEHNIISYRNYDNGVNMGISKFIYDNDDILIANMNKNIVIDYIIITQDYVEIRKVGEKISKVIKNNEITIHNFENNFENNFETFYITDYEKIKFIKPI